MNYVILLVCIQSILLAIFAPISIRVRYHFTLRREQSNIVLSVLHITILRVKIGLNNGILQIEVNGKNKPIKKKKHSEGGFPVEKLPQILTYLRTERIIAFSYLLAYVGGNDAMSCALRICAIRALSPVLLHGYAAFADYDNDRLDIDLDVHGRINLYQIFELIGIKRSKNNG